jgi:acetyltransferase-like isoleucine patch superfamily enzyme
LSNIKQIILQNKKINNVDISETPIPTRKGEVGNYILTKEMKKDVLLTEKALMMSYDVGEDMYKADVILGGSLLKSGSVIKTDSIMGRNIAPSSTSELVNVTTDPLVTTESYCLAASDSSIKSGSKIKAGSTWKGTVLTEDVQLDSDEQPNDYDVLASGCELAVGTAFRKFIYKDGDNKVYYDPLTEKFVKDYTITPDDVSITDGDKIDLIVGSTLAVNSSIVGRIQGKDYTSEEPFVVTSEPYAISKEFLPNGNRLVTVQALKELYDQKESGVVKDTLYFYPQLTLDASNSYTYQTDDITTEDGNIISYENHMDEDLANKYVTADALKEAYLTKVQYNPGFIENNKGKLMTLAAALELTSRPEMQDLLSNNAYVGRIIQKLSNDTSITSYSNVTYKVDEVYDESTDSIKYDISVYDGATLIAKYVNQTTDTVSIATSISVTTDTSFKVEDSYYGFEFEVCEATATITVTIGSTAQTAITRGAFVAKPTKLTTEQQSPYALIAKYVEVGDVRYHIEYGSTAQTFTFVENAKDLIIGNEVILTTGSTVENIATDAQIADNASYDKLLYSIGQEGTTVTITSPPA